MSWRLDNRRRLILLALAVAGDLVEAVRAAREQGDRGGIDRFVNVPATVAQIVVLDGLGDSAGGVGLDSTNQLFDQYNKAIELAPKYGAAYHIRATLFTKMGQTDQATEDIQMVTQLTQQNIESFANENNVWRSNHMQVESIMETELNR